MPVPAGGGVGGQLQLGVTPARDGDGVEIIDIKTSEKRPPMPQHKNQLRLYGEAARTMGMNPVRLTIHDLDSEEGAAIPVDADDRELDRFKEQVCRWISGIRKGDYPKSLPKVAGGTGRKRMSLRHGRVEIGLRQRPPRKGRPWRGSWTAQQAKG